MSDKGLSIFEQEAPKIKENFLEPLEKNEKLQQRFHDENVNRKRFDGEYQRDFTRILYASAFRRLQGKMQLFAIQSDQFIKID